MGARVKTAVHASIEMPFVVERRCPERSWNNAADRLVMVDGSKEASRCFLEFEKEISNPCKVEFSFFFLKICHVWCNLNLLFEIVCTCAK